MAWLSVLPAITFLAVICLVADSNEARTLELVNLVYRHGARAPGYVYPTDPNTLDTWPQGASQLTQNGMRMQYSLGAFLRNRYMFNTSLLNNTYYRREQFYARSSDTDRTLMSAETNLAALFPPYDFQRWNKTLLWQPIPVHTLPIEDDTLLRQFDYDCQQWNDLYEDFLASEEHAQMKANYSEFVEFVGNETGLYSNLTFDNIGLVNDVIVCEEADNRTIADWIGNNTRETLQYLADYNMYSYYSTPEMAKLKGGMIVGKFVENMKNKTRGDLLPDNKYRMMMYSAHDITIAGMMSAMNISNGRIPPFASCLMFELYLEEDGNYTVEIYYRNDSSKSPYPITVPNCDFACPFDTFVNLTRDDYLDDLYRACENGQISKTFRLALIIGVSAAGAFLLVIICVLVCKKFCKCCKRGPYTVQHDDYGYA